MPKITKLALVSVIVSSFLLPNISFAQSVKDDDTTVTSACVDIPVRIGLRSRDVSPTNYVTVLQEFLHDSNYLASNATGFFGSGTVRAVKAFQKANKISQTGSLGPATRAKIKEVSCDDEEIAAVVNLTCANYYEFKTNDKQSTDCQQPVNHCGAFATQYLRAFNTKAECLVERNKSSVVTAPVINSFTASPSTITVGQSTTLSWTNTTAISCTLDEGPVTGFGQGLSIGQKASNGSFVVAPTRRTIYNLVCLNSNAGAPVHSEVAHVTVDVKPLSNCPTGQFAAVGGCVSYDGTGPTPAENNHAYSDLLGRQGDAEGIRYWEGRNISIDQVKVAIRDSAEYKAKNPSAVSVIPNATVAPVATVCTDSRQFAAADGCLWPEKPLPKGPSLSEIDAVYVTHLGRHGDVSGLNSFDLKNLSIAYITELIMSSDEYYSKHNIVKTLDEKNTIWITQVYKQGFCRIPTSSEIARWKARLNAGVSRYDVSFEISNSDEWVDYNKSHASEMFTLGHYACQGGIQVYADY